MDPLTRTRDLARRYFDGLLGPAELDELQRLLATSPEAADAFAGASRLESGLQILFAQEQDLRRQSNVVENIGRRRRRRRWLAHAVRLAAAACVLFLALGTLLAWLARRDGPEPRDNTVEFTGTLEQRDGVARVTSAEAALRLPDGSRVRLQRGSEFVMPSPDGGRLVQMHSGVGRFEVARAEGDFRVETPAGRVTALGTEFSVTLTHEREEESMKTSHLVLAVAVTYGLVLVEAGGERCLLGAGQSRAFAQEERKKDEKKGDERRPDEVRRQAVIRATVESVGEGKLTLSPGRGDAVTIDVPEAAKVFVDGKPAKLADLAKGMVVTIEKEGERGPVTSIRAEGPTVGAVIKSVDKDKIVVAGRGEDKEYAMNKEVKVTVNGKAGALSDLKEGDRVGLGLAVDSKTVMAIVKDSRVFGVVKAVDHKARTITLPIDREGGERTYELAKDAKVTAGERGGEAKLEDVKEGTGVALTLDKDGKTVTAVLIAQRGGDREREGGRFGGEVSDVDEKANTIEIKAERGEKKFSVSKDARISIDGKAGKLGDLKKGDRVTVLLDKDGKTALAIVKGARDGEGRRGVIFGVVKGTEKATRITVLVGDKQEERIFDLAKDVKVSVDGKDAKLDDVKEKARVRLTLGRDEKTVVEIFVGRGRGEGERPERGSRVEGKVKGVAAKEGKITLSPLREKGDDRAFEVAKDAKVTIEGKAAKLEDVKEGAAVVLTLDGEKKVVTEITVGPARRREGDKESEKKD